MRVVQGFSLHHSARPDCKRRRQKTARTTNIIVDSINGRKVNIVLLDDTRVKRVEIHDKDKLIPKSPLRLEDKATFVLIPFAVGRFGCVWVVVAFDL
jgi:hypothetical protein